MPDYEISSVTFGQDGWAIQYIEVPTDVRKTLIRTHQLELSAGHPDYLDDMKRIHDQVVAALVNALEDLNNTPPPPVIDDDDDEKGMGE